MTVSFINYWPVIFFFLWNNVSRYFDKTPREPSGGRGYRENPRFLVGLSISARAARPDFQRPKRVGVQNDRRRYWSLRWKFVVVIPSCPSSIIEFVIFFHDSRQWSVIITTTVRTAVSLVFAVIEECGFRSIPIVPSACPHYNTRVFEMTCYEKRGGGSWLIVKLFSTRAELADSPTLEINYDGTYSSSLWRAGIIMTFSRSVGFWTMFGGNRVIRYRCVDVSRVCSLFYLFIYFLFLRLLLRQNVGTAYWICRTALIRNRNDWSSA